MRYVLKTEGSLLARQDALDWLQSATLEPNHLGDIWVVFRHVDAEIRVAFSASTAEISTIHVWGYGRRLSEIRRSHAVLFVFPGIMIFVLGLLLGSLL